MFLHLLKLRRLGLVPREAFLFASSCCEIESVKLKAKQKQQSHQNSIVKSGHSNSDTMENSEIVNLRNRLSTRVRPSQLLDQVFTMKNAVQHGLLSDFKRTYWSKPNRKAEKRRTHLTRLKAKRTHRNQSVTDWKKYGIKM